MALAAAVVATAVSGVFSATLLRRYLARGRRNAALKYWGASLGMFCVASGMLLVGVAAGWNGAVFRLFYLFGAVLNVPWLALGSVEVNARNRVVTRVTGGLVVAVAALFAWAAAGSATPLLWVPGIVVGTLWGALMLTGDRDAVHAGSVALLGAFTVVAGFFVLSAGLEGAALAAAPAGALPEGSELFPIAVRGFAVGGNAIGSVVVILGAVVSVVHLGWGASDAEVRADVRARGRRAPVEGLAALTLFASRAVRRARLAHLAGGNLLIALGTLLAAAGGMFSFLGDTAGHAVGLALGVTVMYLGFVRTTRPAPLQGAAPVAGARA